MCLLVVLFRLSPTTPLVVAANRDERYDRPTSSISRFGAGHPRIIGGRDELAGGTWLAVNEAGVVAGLTNTPSTTGRDPDKRSRGELPLVLAGHEDAAAAVSEFVTDVRSEDFNPCWLFVADRRSLFYLEISASTARPIAVELTPGMHVLENRPLGARSEKIDRVRAIYRDLETIDGVPSSADLGVMLGDHLTKQTGDRVGTQPGALHTDDALARQRQRRAVCVHSPGYGTRSSTIVSVPLTTSAAPTVLVADGPPCTTSFSDESWRLSRL